MIVPYADLKGQYAALREEILAALDRVGSKAAFILGEEVQEFEREFAVYCGVKHCVAVNSGPSALHLFYPTKNLGVYDEGGALTTNGDALAAQARSLRSHGESRRYHHDAVGYNYRMDGLQAAILRVKLSRLDGWNARRKGLAEIYRRTLAGARVELQEGGAAGERVDHLLEVYVAGRDAVRARLQERGVQTSIHYPVPLHRQKPYQTLGYAQRDCPRAERACERVISMPLYPERSDAQAVFAPRTLRDAVGDMKL